MRRPVLVLSWLVSAAILYSTAVDAWLAITDANPTRTSPTASLAQQIGDVAIFVGLPLLFVGAFLAVRGALPLVGPASAASVLAFLCTLDDYYWPDHQRYIATLSGVSIAFVVALSLTVAALTWMRRTAVAGAALNIVLVLVLFGVLLTHATH